MKRWPGQFWLQPPTIRPYSPLCIRCRDQGYIQEADLGSVDTCHEHLTEDRINNLIKESGAWWA